MDAATDAVVLVSAVVAIPARAAGVVTTTIATIELSLAGRARTRPVLSLLQNTTKQIDLETIFMRSLLLFSSVVIMASQGGCKPSTKAGTSIPSLTSTTRIKSPATPADNPEITRLLRTRQRMLDRITTCRADIERWEKDEIPTYQRLARESSSLVDTSYYGALASGLAQNIPHHLREIRSLEDQIRSVDAQLAQLGHK